MKTFEEMEKLEDKFITFELTFKELMTCTFKELQKLSIRVTGGLLKDKNKTDLSNKILFSMTALHDEISTYSSKYTNN